MDIIIYIHFKITHCWSAQGRRTLAQNPKAQLDKRTNFVRTEAQQIGGLN